ncbi:MAG: FKBP-type peptidyl-prolyl cis-trans isomerase [Sphaerochaetaceae bacterium]|jgi:FKBP-type peptidyl-prolyl cis-trans isomerase FklB|nr:FKBP-type peptidyl-prolyl cis-trans isomerase [Sphaerochaetaceae bacterium]MDD3162680.1 FKBP-type peptidyl-prolyl cis-trans isomerase [Sphaerochaetaceae bacterium]MDD4007046.1 FKBP-type peptidyl-prolyl cis-trans isomerase [Sphaerochaetaceae bacterium]MDD4397271.1 FKBP-type peptidyl-prolyl cis-trans isomerase [Sphaerochaetaceae bacterium]
MKKAFLMMVLFLACAGLFAADGIDFDVNEVGNLGVPSELTDQFSYVYGYILLQSVMKAYPGLNLEYWAKGLYDSASGQSVFTDVQMQQILSDYQMKQVEVNAAAQKKAAADNLEQANSFLAANRSNPKVKETASGLQYEVVREGSGAVPEAGSNVRIDYQCILLDGTVIDSSYARKVPNDLYMTKMIKGLSEGIQLMKVGSKYRFWIPPALGYGENSTNVEPNSLLVFEVELLAINS